MCARQEMLLAAPSKWIQLFAIVFGGLGGFAMVALGAAALTAIFLAHAAAVAAGQVGRRRVRALATAVVLWFALTLLFDVVVLAAAALRPRIPAADFVRARQSNRCGAQVLTRWPSWSPRE